MEGVEEQACGYEKLQVREDAGHFGQVCNSVHIL